MTTGGTDGWMTKRAGRRGLWTAAVLAAGLGALALVAPPLTPGTIESAPVTVITTTPPAPAMLAGMLIFKVLQTRR